VNNYGTQRDRILRLLTSRVDQWVPLPEILDLQIGQYNARILELRRAGYNIENKKMRSQDGICRSWYCLHEKQVSL
jgi:hypothetical protein